MERTTQNKYQNKKSFILYLDQLNILDDLEDDEAGKLFKTIAHFIHTGEDLPMDKIIKIAYLPIRQSLKRDLEKWRNQLQANRENGKLGGRPKKPKGKKKNPINPSGCLDNPINPVNVNVNVNDNVIVNVKKQYKEFVADELKFIKITEEEYKKLSSKYSISDITNYLKQISLYVGTSGKKYKSHYMACLSWFNRDGIKTTEEKEQIKKDGW